MKLESHSGGFLVASHGVMICVFLRIKDVGISLCTCWGQDFPQRTHRLQPVF